MMPTLTLFPDGIIVQHVGELLFDTQGTRDLRRHCSRTYSECLERFAFSVLVADRIALPSRFPPVLEERPGKKIRNSLTAALVDQIRFSDHTDDLRRDSNFRSIVAEDIAELSRALELDRQAWEHWIVREAKLVFDERSGSAIHRNRVGFAAHYFQDSDLEVIVPASFVAHLVGVVQDVLPAAAHVIDLERFLRETTVTHLLTFRSRERMTKSEFYPGCVQLPHATRSVVQRISTEKRDCGRLFQVFSPAIAADALRITASRNGSREEIITAVQELREERSYRKLRTRLKQVIEEANQAPGDLKPIRQLCDEANAIVLGHTPEPTSFSVCATDLSDGKLRWFDVAEYFRGFSSIIWNRRFGPLRQILSGYSRDQYDADTKRLFPEMRDEHRARRAGM